MKWNVLPIDCSHKFYTPQIIMFMKEKFMKNHPTKISCYATICGSTYQKAPVVGRLYFELRRCKVKISQNMFPRSIFRFHVFSCLQYLLHKFLEGYGVEKSAIMQKLENKGIVFSSCRVSIVWYNTGNTIILRCYKQYF